jgi:hypothetical protein
MTKKIWPLYKKSIILVTQGNTISGYQILSKNLN